MTWSSRRRSSRAIADAIRVAVEPYASWWSTVPPDRTGDRSNRRPRSSRRKTRRRVFEQVLRRFIGVFARREHPPGSVPPMTAMAGRRYLDLVQHLCSSKRRVSVSGRSLPHNDGSGPEHPLMRRLDALRKAGAPVSEIKLAPLALSDVSLLVADTLHDEPSRSAGRARARQDGGPSVLHDPVLYRARGPTASCFRSRPQRWAWDLSRIGRAASPTTSGADDREDHPAARVSCREAMQIMACLGTPRARRCWPLRWT